MAVIEGRPNRGALLNSRVSALTGSRAGSLTIFIVKRIFWMVPIVFFVILITFLLMHSTAGSFVPGTSSAAPAIVAPAARTIIAVAFRGRVSWHMTTSLVWFLEVGRAVSAAKPGAGSKGHSSPWRADRALALPLQQFVYGPAIGGISP